VTVVAFGWDTALLTRLPSGSNALEQSLLDRLHGHALPRATLSSGAQRGVDLILASTVAAAASAARPLLSLPMEGTLPDLPGDRIWLNSPPLSSQSLRGKVVLIDFWTFACVNCQNALPHVREWSEKYKDQGLVVIGVHAPEFAFERRLDNVKHAVGNLGLKFPIVIDNVRDMAVVFQPVVAGELLRRRPGTHSLPPLRGRRVREVRAGDSATSGRGPQLERCTRVDHGSDRCKYVNR
jgi:thiol-disulfide isomerase/thioredoxin